MKRYRPGIVCKERLLSGGRSMDVLAGGGAVTVYEEIGDGEIAVVELAGKKEEVSCKQDSFTY